MVARPHLWSKMEENPFILASSTFGGNPLGCAEAIAGIHAILEEDIPGQARDKGTYFLRTLQELQQKYPEVSTKYLSYDDS
jgi:putrescine aminotransferase